MIFGIFGLLLIISIEWVLNLFFQNGYSVKKVKKIKYIYKIYIYKYILLNLGLFKL